MKDAYQQAGVDIEAGNEVVNELKNKMTAKDSHILGHLGSFAGCYELDQQQLESPVLVAGSDGVGTKVLLAAQANQVTTIGQDLVAMCVNDLLAQGAMPLFFLDYLALAHVEKQQIAQILDGILTACQNNQLTLLGGETAEMPGVYQPHHFDLAGFAVGLAKKSALLSAQNVHEHDQLIGLPSSGLHSNGFSLVRKLLFEDQDFQFSDVLPEFERPLIQELLEPTKIYTASMRPLLEQNLLAGAAHITGGGLIENLPRMLPTNLKAQIKLGSWQKPAIFTFLQKLGNLSQKECYQTFNMGIGMVLIVREQQLANVQTILGDLNQPFYRLGEVQKKTDDENSIEFVEAQDD